MQTVIVKKHSMNDAITMQGRIATKEMDQLLDEFENSYYYINDPQALMDKVILPKLYDVYCKYCIENNIERFVTIYFNTWDKHDRELCGIIRNYTSYKTRWLPKVNKQIAGFKINISWKNIAGKKKKMKGESKGDLNQNKDKR